MIFDSESEGVTTGVATRLGMLLASSSDGSLPVSQVAAILNTEASFLIGELNTNTVLGEVVAYDSTQQTIHIRPEGRSRLPDLLKSSSSTTWRHQKSDSESSQHPYSPNQLSLTESKLNATRRHRVARKVRPRLGFVHPPVEDHRAGRVGYVCVADELNLSALEAHYRDQGYYTKFDFDVLHVRFEDPNSPSNDGASVDYGADESLSPISDATPGAAATRFHEKTVKNNGFDLFLFEYGAVVWWGFNTRYFKIVESDFMVPHEGTFKYMTHRYPTQLVNENYPVWCTYNLVRKETLEIDREFVESLRFDHFLIPYGKGDPNTCSIAMLCASHALAQSAKIDYLEIKVQELTVSCTPLPRELRDKGSVTVSERRLLQLRGEVLSYRLMLRSGSDLIDEPSFFWENAYLKPVFQATKEGFEIATRVEALDNKLDATNEILSMLAEEFSQRHGARLEWIVIWLVFVEVIIGVLELLVDVRPWFRR